MVLQNKSAGQYSETTTPVVVILEIRAARSQVVASELWAPGDQGWKKEWAMHIPPTLRPVRTLTAIRAHVRGLHTCSTDFYNLIFIVCSESCHWLALAVFDSVPRVVLSTIVTCRCTALEFPGARAPHSLRTA